MYIWIVSWCDDVFKIFKDNFCFYKVRGIFVSVLENLKNFWKYFLVVYVEYVFLVYFVFLKFYLWFDRNMKKVFFICFRKYFG